MFEENAAPLGMITHATANTPGWTTHLLEALARDVRHLFLARPIAPKVFRRVKFRGVRRQVFHAEPRSLLPQIGLDVPPPMRRQPVPQEDRLSASKMTLPSPQVIENLRLSDRTGMKSQTQANPTPGWRGDQTGWCPTAVSNGRVRSAPAFFPEAPTCVARRDPRKSRFRPRKSAKPVCGALFLICGQRFFRQRPVAVSSRSRARRAGRWQLQPNCLKSCHTCPG